MRELSSSEVPATEPGPVLSLKRRTGAWPQGPAPCCIDVGQYSREPIVVENGRLDGCRSIRRVSRHHFAETDERDDTARISRETGWSEIPIEVCVPPIGVAGTLRIADDAKD